MFSVSNFTTGCNPTRETSFDTLKKAVKCAVQDVDWLYDRAFGAADTTQIDGQEDAYEEIKKKINGVTKLKRGEHISFGPLPDGYNIKIANEAG